MSGNNQLKDLKTLSILIDMKHKQLLINLVERMMGLKQKGMSNYDILMHNISDEIQELAQTYGENLAIKHCIRSLDKLKQGRQIMINYFTLFAW